METGSVKPVGFSAAPVAPRQDDARVPTDIAPERAVVAARKSEPTTSERDVPARDERRTVEPLVSRSYNLDAATGSFVFRVTREETGDVIAQYPADEILKLRAYLKESEPPPAEPSIADVA